MRLLGLHHDPEGSIKMVVHKLVEAGVSAWGFGRLGAVNFVGLFPSSPQFREILASCVAAACVFFHFKLAVGLNSSK